MARRPAEEAWPARTVTLAAWVRRASSHRERYQGALSQYEKAIGYYEQPLAIQREIEERQGGGETLNNPGDAALAERAHSHKPGGCVLDTIRL
ncbi:MAG: hypothetical protein ACLQU1_31460 [Bryobacteraceae bacterium]